MVLDTELNHVKFLAKKKDVVEEEIIVKEQPVKEVEEKPVPKLRRYTRRKK